MPALNSLLRWADRLSLRDRPAPLQWGALLALTVILIGLFELLRLPAALLLGALAAAVVCRR